MDENHTDPHGPYALFPTVLIFIVESVFIFLFLPTGENGKTIMKPVYPLCRKKKIGKSKIDIDFQFLILKNDPRTAYAT